ncbi:hypothetical protein BDW72DRAFT_169485 [Aspergillus terricola var. indicus]
MTMIAILQQEQYDALMPTFHTFLPFLSTASIPSTSFSQLGLFCCVFVFALQRQ